MTKTNLAIFLVFAMLTACVPVVFLAGATVGGAVVYDKRPLEIIAKDRDIAYKAAVKINSDPELEGKIHIAVASFNRILLLVGQAPTQEMRDHAYKLASSVDDIRNIYNEVQIQEPLAMTSRSQDTWITTKVKAVMLGQKGLSSTQIKVITEDKIVYLMGMVTKSQGQLAADVASQVSGVTKVKTIFEYNH